MLRYQKARYIRHYKKEHTTAEVHNEQRKILIISGTISLLALLFITVILPNLLK